MHRPFRLALAACFPLFLAACVISPKNPENTPDGLVRVQSKRVDSLFIVPGMSLLFDSAPGPLPCERA